MNKSYCRKAKKKGHGEKNATSLKTQGFLGRSGLVGETCRTLQNYMYHDRVSSKYSLNNEL